GAAIQVPWHIWRVWMMKFLQIGRGYSERAALNFNSLYYLVAGIGCLGVGMASLGLARRWNLSPHRARRWIYTGACAMTSLGVLVPWLNSGPLLLGIILIIGVGGVSLFPLLYSFEQELTERHLGQVIGCMTFWAWAVTSPMQSLFGWYAQR